MGEKNIVLPILLNSHAAGKLRSKKSKSHLLTLSIVQPCTPLSAPCYNQHVTHVPHACLGFGRPLSLTPVCLCMSLCECLNPNSRLGRWGIRAGAVRGLFIVMHRRQNRQEAQIISEGDVCSGYYAFREQRVMLCLQIIAALLQYACYINEIG